MAKIDLELKNMSRECANEMAGHKPKTAQKRTGTKKKTTTKKTTSTK